VREYALTLAIVAAVTYLLTPVARRLALRVGAMAPVRDRDVHAIPTPRLGGVAMYAGIAAGMLVASRLPHLKVTFVDYHAPQAVLLAGAVIVAVGVVDDIWGLDPVSKLAGQTLAAGVMVLMGISINVLPNPLHEHSYIALGQLGVPLTISLVVVTINAVNFIDGLDGLAAGVVGISALSLLAYVYQLAVVHGLDRLTPPALIAATLAGACLGFLPHNFNPARVFMGDSGSMLLGLCLAAATTGITGQYDPSAVQRLDLFPALLPLLLCGAVLAIPFVDLLLAVVRRTRSGRSPFSPDKLHLHHRLLEIGHSQTRAVLIMYLWTALLAFTAVAVSIKHLPMVVIPIASTVAVVGLLVISVPRLRAARRPSA